MEIKLPGISGRNGDAILTSWYFSESEFVSEGENLVEVVTDKAAFDIQSPCSGVLERICKKEGEKISVNDLLAEINENGSRNG